MNSIKSNLELTLSISGFIKKLRYKLEVRESFIEIVSIRFLIFSLNCLKKLKYFFHIKRRKSYGASWTELEISNICNAKCVFCPYVDILESNKHFQVMSPETFKRVLEKLKYLNNPLINITPTTGETLINPNWDKLLYELLKLPKIKRIRFFTNGILMNEENQNKFLSLLNQDNKSKIYMLIFSVGGCDRKTYEFMCGVDKFDLVVKNINELQKKLIKSKKHVEICIDLRLPKNIIFNLKNAENIFNKHKYFFNTIKVVNSFYSTQYLIKYEEIDYLPISQPRNNVCSYLKKTRFAADGSIWADGCVLSELPNDFSLKLGTIDDSWKIIEEQRKKLIDDWQRKGILPTPCETCTIYLNDGVSIAKDKTNSMWQKLYT